MPHWENVERAHVESAVQECDRVGDDAFLAEHGFARARGHVLWHDERSYDSKAILGVAHGYATGQPATSDDFSGGGTGAAKILRSLGFEVGSPKSASATPPPGRPTKVLVAKPRVAQQPATLCPTCRLEMSVSGLCDNCD